MENHCFEVHSGEFSRDENEIEKISYCKLSRNNSFILCIRGAAARKCVFAPHRVNSKFEIMWRMEHGPFSLDSLCSHSVHKNCPAKERKDKETKGKRAESTGKTKTLRIKEERANSAKNAVSNDRNSDSHGSRFSHESSDLSRFADR